MALAQIKVTPKLTPTGRAKKNTFEATILDIDDLGYAVQVVTAQEIEQQRALGNDPTHLIVDNSGSKPVSATKYRIQTFFADSKVAAQAAMAIYKELKKLTRVDTTLARSSFEIWATQDTFKKGSEYRVFKHVPSVGLLEKLMSSLPEKGRIIVAGPMVPYGRKLYWNPAGKKRQRQKYRKGFNADTKRIVRVKVPGQKINTNMRQLAMSRVKRKYPGVLIVGRWIQAMTVNKDDRWPGIAIGTKSKGKIK